MLVLFNLTDKRGVKMAKIFLFLTAFEKEVLNLILDNAVEVRNGNVSWRTPSESTIRQLIAIFRRCDNYVMNAAEQICGFLTNLAKLGILKKIDIVEDRDGIPLYKVVKPKENLQITVLDKREPRWLKEDMLFLVKGFMSLNLRGVTFKELSTRVIMELEINVREVEAFLQYCVEEEIIATENDLYYSISEPFCKFHYLKETKITPEIQELRESNRERTIKDLSDRMENILARLKGKFEKTLAEIDEERKKLCEAMEKTGHADPSQIENLSARLHKIRDEIERKTSVYAEVIKDFQDDM
jgi:hypothetical protein